MEDTNEFSQEVGRAKVSSVTLGYGLILATAVIVFSLIVFLLDIDRQSWINYFSYVIIVAGIVITQINYRNKYMNGLIPYGKAFLVGFVMMIFTSVAIAIWTFIFFKFIDPGAIEENLRVAEEKMIERGMSDIEIDQAWPFVKMMNTVVAYTIFALLGNILIGLIVSLITAIFVKKEDPNAMPTA